MRVDDARVFYNKKCMKRMHSKRADVSKNEENSTLLMSDSYERKDTARKKKKRLHFSSSSSSYHQRAKLEEEKFFDFARRRKMTTIKATRSRTTTSTATTADAGSSESLFLSSFKVHPTVLLSCTDHHKRTTREKTDDEKTRKKNALGAAGLLLGHRGGGEEGGQGRGGDALEEKKSATATTGAGEEFCVSITNCFEIEYYGKEEDKDKDYVVDAEFLQRMQNNYKQTFQDLEVVGWYFCSVFEEESKEEDEEEKKTFQRRVHEQIGECVKDVIDCPMVLLTVNAKVVVRGGDGRGKENEEDEKNAEKKRAALPAKLYRYEETDETFKPIAYGIDASSAERVASDHASKATEKTELETKESRVLAYLTEQRVSVKALRDRIGTMLEFLEKEVAGENEEEDDALRFEILRRLNAICAQKDTQLPNTDKATREKSDAALIETLTKLTKACADTESFARRFNAAYKKEDIDSSSNGGIGHIGGIDEKFFGGVGLMERFDHRIPTIPGASRRGGEGTGGGGPASLRSRRQQAAAASSMQID